MTDTLPCGVMVARRILVPPVGVRIPLRQQRSSSTLERFIYTRLISGSIQSMDGSTENYELADKLQTILRKETSQTAVD